MKEETGLWSFYRAMEDMERRTFWSCFLGWMLDSLDFMIYPLVIGTIIAMWNVDRGLAGLAVTTSMLSSSIGGWLAGFLSDRFGRVKTLQVTIAWFCGFTLLCALAQNFDQLLVARTLLGLGFGGEWAAGAVLMGETIRPAFRGRAVGCVQSAWAVGWGAAVVLQAVTFSLLPAETAWRAMFVVGALPAALLFLLRRNVREPQIVVELMESAAKKETPGILAIFARPMLPTTILASLFVMGCIGSYYSIATWLPTFLKNERHLTIVNSTGYLAILIVGNFAGYICAAWMADRFGRKALFMTFSVGALSMVLAYALLPVTNNVILWLGFPLGFFTGGYTSGIGPLLTELYPTSIRGSGQGFCYNFGRGIGSLFPTLVGFFSASIGLASAICWCAAIAYILMFVTAACLPETKGRELRSV